MSRISKEKTVAHIKEQFRLFEGLETERAEGARSQLRACIDIVEHMDEEATCYALLDSAYYCSNCHKTLPRFKEEVEKGQRYCQYCGFKIQGAKRG